MLIGFTILVGVWVEIRVSRLAYNHGNGFIGFNLRLLEFWGKFIAQTFMQSKQ